MTSKPVLEPAAQQFADATANPPFLFDLGPVKGRETVDQVQSGDIAKPDVDVSDMTVPGGPSGEVSIRILRPRNTTGPLPVIVYIHGAGWVVGNAHTHDRLIRELAVGANAAVVFPNYSLSPEAKYPTAIEESYAVAAWVAQHGAEQNLDSTRIAVAGDSVGGNMTAALTLLAKERGDVRFVQQVLFYPVTDANFDTESYHQFGDGYFLRRDAMQWFWDQYTTDPAQRAEITASPLRASLDELADLPPALVITADADVLRDEGEAYAAKLRAAGVSVTAARYQGTIHDFVMLNALRGTYAAGAAIAQAITTLAGALHPTGDNDTRSSTSRNAVTKTVEVEGISFAYREVGPTTGVPVVFLHHFTAVLDDWDPAVVDGIAAGRRVILVDLQGVGGSGGTTPDSIEAMAADAIAFLQALGLGTVDLLGFSLGGMVAQLIVEQRPDLVRRVILAGTAPAGDQGPAATGAVLQAAVEKASAQGKHPKHFLFFSPTATSQAAADAFLARVDERTKDRDAPVSNETIGAQLTALAKWEQGSSPAGLTNVDKPVLVVNGDDDTMVPTISSFHLAQLLPDAQLSIYPSSGHGGIFQYHHLFVAQALAFLRD
ncbi:MAG: acetyl esterase [Pseudonocardiales bacterium]|nr:acetyl esterase [Pseudonocardiales bacterium]